MAMTDREILADFFELPEAERRDVMRDKEIANAIFQAMDRDPDFQQLPLQDRADLFVESGIPLRQLRLPAGDPMDLGEGMGIQVPQLGTGPSPIQAEQSPLASAISSFFSSPATQPPGIPPVTLQHPASPSIRPPAAPAPAPTYGLPPVTLQHPNVGMSALPNPFNNTNKAFGQPPATLQHPTTRLDTDTFRYLSEMVDKPEDNFYNKILRGVLGALPGTGDVRPPGTHPDFLSIENTAKFATAILATAGSMNPFGMLGRLGAAATMGGLSFSKALAGGMLTSKAGATLPFNISQMTNWFIQNPAVSRAIVETAYQSGRFTSLEVAREMISRKYREGTLAEGEAQAVFGPALLRDLMIGVPLSLGISGAIGGAKWAKQATKLGSQIADAAMSGLNQGALQVTRLVDDVLWPTKTLVSLKTPQSVDLKSLVPRQQVENTAITLRGASKGDIIWYKDGEAAIVTARTPNGLEVQKVMQGKTKGYELLPYDYDEKAGKGLIKKIEGMRGPLVPGMEVTDDAAQGFTYIFDRYVPNGKAYVIDWQGNRLLKDPKQLKTELDVYTIAEAKERAAHGAIGSGPEGRMTWSDYEVTSVDKEGNVLYKKPDGEIINAIPYRVVTDPIPDPLLNFNTLWYALDPPVVLHMMNKPETTAAAREMLERNIKSRALLNEFQQQALGWQRLVGKSKETSEKLTRVLSGVSPREETISDQELAALEGMRAFARDQLYPLLNAKRASRNEPPIPDNFPLPFVLFPEIALNSGNKYLLSGVPIKDFATLLEPTGVGNMVTVKGMVGTPAEELELEIKANVWDWLDHAMKFAAEESAFGGFTDKLKGLAANFRRNPASSASGTKYIEWLASSLDGRTSSGYMSDLVGESKRLQRFQDWLVEHKKLPAIGGTVSTAKLGDYEIQSPAWPLREIDLYDWSRAIKTLSYKALIGLSVNTFRTNISQPWTHTLPALPARSMEEFGRNVGEVAAGAVKGVGYASLAGTQALLKKIFNEEAAIHKLFSSERLDYYRQNGVMGDFDEIFSPKLEGVGGVLTNIKSKIDTLLFANMRASEIINRVATHSAVVNVTKDDIRRKGIMLAMEEPDVVAAIDQLGKVMASTTQFLYGKGFKSLRHERAWAPSPEQDFNVPKGDFRLMGPISEIVHHLNTFAYKTTSTYVSEARQFMKKNPNYHNAIAKVDSPEEFARYLETLDTESRYLFWRTLGIRTVVGATLATMTGLLGVGLSAYGLSYNIPHPITATIRAFEKAKAAGPIHGWYVFPGEMLNQFFWGANAVNRAIKGKTLQEKIVQSPNKRERRKGVGREFYDWVTGESVRGR